MKNLILLITLLSSQVGYAAYQMDCGTNRSDIVIRYLGNKRVTINYSLPGNRQDKWYGPYKGSVQAEEEYNKYSFKDGTYLELWVGREEWETATGTVILGQSNRRLSERETVTCRAPRRLPN